MIGSKQELEALGKDVAKHVKKRIENNISKYDNMQDARKVQLNSAYGALGNQYFRHYDIRLAEAITKSGQLSIRWIARKVNEHLNGLLNTDIDYIVAGDTDSIYIRLGGLVKSVMPDETDPKKITKFLDKACKLLLTPHINQCYGELALYMNAYEQKMVMKREVIANKGIWTAKKRYVLNVYDNEGVVYDEPEIKVMGLESVKSSTPEVCRDKLKDAMKIIMNETEDDLIRFIEEFKEEFLRQPVEAVSFPRGVNGMEKYKGTTDIYTKGTPIHVKGALIYNSLLKRHKLKESHQEIRNGDKIKFAYLKVPNPIQSTVISMLNGLPEEFDLARFVDYDTQFTKTFVDPLRVILDTIGWHTEKVYTLDSFFD